MSVKGGVLRSKEATSEGAATPADVRKSEQSTLDERGSVERDQTFPGHEKLLLFLESLLLIYSLDVPTSADVIVNEVSKMGLCGGHGLFSVLGNCGSAPKLRCRPNACTFTRYVERERVQKIFQLVNGLNRGSRPRVVEEEVVRVARREGSGAPRLLVRSKSPQRWSTSHHSRIEILASAAFFMFKSPEASITQSPLVKQMSCYDAVFKPLPWPNDDCLVGTSSKRAQHLIDMRDLRPEA